MNSELGSNAPCAIGIDVGGSKIAGGIVAADGRILARQVIPTSPERGGEAVLTDALSLAALLLGQCAGRGCRAVAIGVGVCELVDERGEVVSEQTIRWRGLPILDRFTALAPARIEADSRAAGYAEARFGAGRPYPSILFVTVGTGIGSSWIVDGEPHRGARGCAGTLATAPVTVFPTDGHDQPMRFVLEDFASGPALVRRYNLRAKARAMGAEEVLAAAAGGDSDAAHVVQTGAQALGSTLGLLVNVLDPAAIVVGGGLGAAPGLYWETLVTSTRAHVWSEAHRDLPIRQAALGGDAGFVGAAALALSRMSQPG
jgi:glucokinase